MYLFLPQVVRTLLCHRQFESCPDDPPPFGACSLVSGCFPLFCRVQWAALFFPVWSQTVLLWIFWHSVHVCCVPSCFKSTARPCNRPQPNPNRPQPNPNQTLTEPQPNPNRQVMADLAVWLVTQVAVGLTVSPWGRGDAAAAHEPLPPPMLPGASHRLAHVT